MGNVRSGIPIELAVRLRDRLGLGSAVETGTFRGDSANLLADHFPAVWSIELSPELHKSAVARLAHRDHITVLEGSSRERLHDVCAALTTPALFWLDGHWSGSGTAGELDECPVLAEIAIIDSAPRSDTAVILIDDARLFFGPPPPPHRREDWPTFLEVAHQLTALHDRYVTALEDVIIAVPATARDVVDQYWLDAQGLAEGKASPRRSRWRRQ